MSWLAPGPPASGELSLQHGAVAVSCAWANQYSGTSGAGVPAPLTAETGYLYFFSPTNYEVFVKVLDWYPDKTSYQLFWGGLTDLEYTLTFRQTSTGQALVFKKEAGSLCGGLNTTDLQNPGPVPASQRFFLSGMFGGQLTSVPTAVLSPSLVCMASLEWEAGLTGDLLGTSYTFHLGVMTSNLSSGAGTFLAEILQRRSGAETVLASTTLTTSPQYAVSNVVVAGLDPAAQAGDSLLFRLTRQSGVPCLYFSTGAGDTHYIDVPARVP